MAATVNAMDLQNGINIAVDAAVSDLKSRVVMISTLEEIGSIAATTDVFRYCVFSSFHLCQSIF